jgi:predicted nucleic acid-binding protein
VAALFDSTVAVLHLRRKPPREALSLLQAAQLEIDAGSALIAAPSVSELLMGERSPEGVKRLETFLRRMPSVAVVGEVAAMAGDMGSFLAAAGAPIPFPDLLIAATAVWVEIPLLTWDADYDRSRELAARSQRAHAGAALWRELVLHPTSRAGRAAR